MNRFLTEADHDLLQGELARLTSGPDIRFAAVFDTSKGARELLAETGDGQWVVRDPRLADDSKYTELRIGTRDWHLLYVRRVECDGEANDAVVMQLAERLAMVLDPLAIRVFRAERAHDRKCRSSRRA